jgi:FkbM family methyltransferase
MKSFAQKRFRDLVNSAGFEIVYQGQNLDVKDYCATEYAKQVHLSRLLKTFDINCVFDVGANTGQYAQELRELGYEGLILSFEPVSTTYFSLKDTAQGDPLWHTYPFALGAENTTLEINLYESDSQFNSFLPASTHQKDLFTTGIVADRTEVVEVKTLDSIYTDVTQPIQGECRPLFKLDTQGFDLEVVKGGTRSLQHAIALQSELSFIPVYAGMPNYAQSLELFESLGFLVTNLFPIMGSDRGFAAIEFDCMMVASKALAMNQTKMPSPAGLA